VIYVDYKMPSDGLGSDFSQYERPLTFAERYTNRFRNVTGGAERRPGMQRFSGAVPGGPNLTRLHEHVGDTGAETLLASDDSGGIWRYDDSLSAWASARSGGAAARYVSGQAAGKLIFVNGQDRNVFTDDGGRSFRELKAIITRGAMAGGTTTSALVDGDISNWVGATLVANNDIVYNVTRGAYGIVTAVASASLGVTVIGTTGTGAGLAASNQQSGDQYELIDHVDMNIIPQANGTKDNVATAGPGTTAAVVAVSGVDFSATEIRRGDFVYNTTREAIGLVGSVSASVNVQQQIAGQTAGDSLAFFKSAMPIASWVHVHYGRAYYLDSRNQNRVVISAPDDPEDVTTYQKTLDTSSFSFGTQQPAADVVKAMGTFQSYFVAGGTRNIYIYRGDTPIKDASTTELDFEPVAAYPDGLAGRYAMGQNGSELLYIADDGLQAISIGNISNTTVHNSVSTPIREEIASFIDQASEADIQLSFYPRRGWNICKVGDRCYVLNNNPSYDDAGQLQVRPAWHLFTGKWAQQNHYFTRRNGDLLACGAGGLVYYMDGSAATDDGETVSTDVMTAWIRLEEPQKTRRVKRGHYIKPVFESSPDIDYTVNVVAGWDNFSSDSIIVSAGGTGAIGTAVVGTTPIGVGGFTQADKFALSWRGEEARLQFTTNSSASPDIITGFTLYGDIGGVR
jgi:hypothetical protein